MSSARPLPVAGAPEDASAFARRQLAALAEHFFVPLRQQRIRLVLGERDEQPALRENVERLVEQVELQLPLTMGGHREDRRIEPARQIPQVGGHLDRRWQTQLDELLAELAGLMDVHLVADGLDRPEPGT